MMPTNLKDLFREFWNAAERSFDTKRDAAKPLFALRDAWEDWWQGTLTEEEQQQHGRLIEQAPPSEQEDFIVWLRSWWPGGHAGALTLILVQLAQTGPFRSWQALGRFRPGRFRFVNTIFLQNPVGGEHKDVKPLAAVLLPRNKNDPLFRLINLELDPAGLQNVHRAVSGMLRGWGLLRLGLLLAFLGLDQRGPWLRRSLVLGWVVVLGLLVLLLAGPAPSRESFVRGLQLAYFVAGILVFVACVGYAQGLACAVRLSATLRASQVCVLADGLEQGVVLQANGPSFGVSLAMAIVLALWEDHSKTDQQANRWGEGRDGMAARVASWAFTGDLDATGSIRPVQRLEDKVDAARDDLAISHLCIPRQGHGLGSILPRNARDAMALRLSRCGRLGSLLFKTAGFSTPPRVALNAMALLPVLLLCTAVPDLIRLLIPPLPPQIILWRSEEVDSRSDGPILRLVVETSAPAAFRLSTNAAGVSSLPIPFQPDYYNPARATAELRLPGGHADRNTHEAASLLILIVRPERFLWRELEDTVVLQESYRGLRQAIEDEHSRLLKP